MLLECNLYASDKWYVVANFSLNLFVEFHLPDGDALRAADMQCHNDDSEILHYSWLCTDLPASPHSVTVGRNIVGICRLVTGQCLWQSRRQAQGSQFEE